MTPLANSFRTRKGFEVSNPAGTDRILIQMGGQTLFEVDLGGGSNMTIQISGDLSINVGGNISLTAGRSVTVSSGSNMNLNVASNVTATVGAGATLQAGRQLNLAASTIGITSAGAVTISGNALTSTVAKLTIQSSTTALILSGNEMDIKAGGVLNLKGSRINQN